MQQTLSEEFRGILFGYKAPPDSELQSRFDDGLIDDQDELEAEESDGLKPGSRNYVRLLERMRELHIQKNTGYSGHQADTWYNFRSCERWGGDPLDGVMFRMTDKWSRLESLKLSEANDLVGESMSDTLMDLAAYSLILICLRQERGLT
jgi:hypothetical protein